VLTVRHHDQVRELILTTRLTRAVRFRVSAFVCRGFLIDTGFPRIRSELLAYLEREPVQGAIVTHWHEDHAGNVTALAERGVPVVVSDETLRAHRAMPTVPPYRWAIWGHPRPGSIVPRSSEHPFTLVPTPGHTDDHIAVWDAETGTLFSGDLFLGVKASFVHAEESVAALIASLERVAALGPDRMFDAHRGLVDRPVAALRAKIEWLEKTASAVRTALANGVPEGAIVAKLLGGEAPVAFFSFGQVSRRNFVRVIRADARAGVRSP